jgi:hypothetical protein
VKGRLLSLPDLERGKPGRKSRAIFGIRNGEIRASGTTYGGCGSFATSVPP